MGINRYRNLNILQGRKFYESSDFPTRSQLDAIPTIKISAARFDRLDNLAHIHLGDSSYWWIIALFNDIDWMYKFEEGQILSIPADVNDVLKLF